MTRWRDPAAQHGFSLFELLVVLAVVGVLAGYAMSGLPRILSGNAVGDAARRLAGAGNEARQMAILQQRPWELTLDLDTGEYSIGPAGVLARVEAASDVPEPVTGGTDGESGQARMAVRVQLAREKQKSAKQQTLKQDRLWQAADAYTEAEDRAFLTRFVFPETVRVAQVAEGDEVIEGTRISVFFSGRGYAKPTTIWLDEVEAVETEARHTVHFPGVMSPEVARGFVLPDDYGVLREAQASGESW